jgi:DUF2946 family protein
MRAFRRQTRLVMLALLALAVQVVLSFGHVHHHDASVASITATAVANIAGELLSPNSSVPADDDDDEGHCPICAAMFLTAATAFSPPPVVPEPGFLLVQNAWGAVRIALRAMPVAAFQARGPPAQA